VESVLHRCATRKNTAMALLDRFERFLDQVIPPPDDVSHAVRRGEALLAAGDGSGALRVADAALAVAPAFLRAFTLRVDALCVLERYPEALVALDACHRERALSATIMARMVELSARVGDVWRSVDLSSQTLAKLRTVDADVGRRFVMGARHLLARGNEPEGLRLARAATLADPRATEAWLLLGHDAFRRGDRTLARRSLDRALEACDASEPTVNRMAGELALGLGDPTLAMRHLRRSWIAGDTHALSALLEAALATKDEVTLDRVLAVVDGETGSIARAIVALERGEQSPSLEAAHGGVVPQVLWKRALQVTLQHAPDIAERWCREAPERPAAKAVLALAHVRSETTLGTTGMVASLEIALEEEMTREATKDFLRKFWTQAWSIGLGALIDGVLEMVRFSGRDDVLVRSLEARRRELDEPLRAVILGEFSAGKSTFLNAFVGAEVSPMGVLPTTAHVHRLRYGTQGARIFDRRGGVVEASLEEAPFAVARRREAMVAIDHVEISLPVPRLAQIELIDTPGFNSGDSAHEEAVRRAFDMADVALWLFDARQAGRQSEVEPIEEARSLGIPVLGILNKIDQVPTEKRREVLALVRKGFGASCPCVLAVSARRAWTASQSNKSGEGDTHSGWPTLDAYLRTHLIEPRRVWKDHRVARRMAVIVDEARKNLAQEATRQSERIIQCGTLQESLRSLREVLPEVGNTLRKEVALALRDQLQTSGTERQPEINALRADAIAEVGWRARERALSSLSARIEEIERLAVQTGMVSEHAHDVVTAPLVLWLDHAIAAGVLDAAERSERVQFLASDPTVRLDAALDRVVHAQATPHTTLRLALDVAQILLSEVTVPTWPLPELHTAVPEQDA
jgi:cellulose synthase operon protein C